MIYWTVGYGVFTIATLWMLFKMGRPVDSDDKVAFIGSALLWPMTWLAMVAYFTIWSMGWALERTRLWISLRKLKPGCKAQQLKEMHRLMLAIRRGRWWQHDELQAEVMREYDRLYKS